MADADLSQVYAEAAAVSSSVDADLSWVHTEAASVPSSVPGNASSVYAEVAAGIPGTADLSEVHAEAASVPSSVPRDLSQVYVEALSVANAVEQTGLTVELFLFGAWIDISPYVYYHDKIKIGRGKPNETSRIQPQTGTMTINNRDGRFSPRNPTGPYYGQIGRNTPLRVSRAAGGTHYFRFHGEVPSWPTTYDITAVDVRVRIGAAGQMRRLFQGSQALRSAFFRAYALGYAAAPRPVAYWPCEDGQNSGSIASGLPGGAPMALSGQAPPTFASNTSFACSTPLPLLSASIWTGAIPAYTVGSANVLRFLMFIPLTGAFDTGVLARMYTAGTVARLDLQYGAASDGQLSLSGYDGTGTQLFTTGYVGTGISGGGPVGFNGLPVFVSMELQTSGSDVLYTISFAPLLAVAGAYGIYFTPGFGTLSTADTGHATQVIVNPDGHFNDTAVGHVIYQSAHDLLTDTSFQLNANIGETAGARFTRLCTEQGVTAVLAGSSEPTSMGYQLSDTFANLIQESADSGAAPLYEARDQLALVLRGRPSLYNQTARLTLDHSANQLSAPLVPVDDDAITRNDVTVRRIGGSSNQQTLTSGALSTQPPPDGVGGYPTSYNLSLSSDSLLPDHAGWRLHLGTTDRPRYPQIAVNLRHPTFTGDPVMMAAALSVEVGDRIVIINPPPFLPPDPISLIVQGYSETLGTWEHDIVFNCSPEEPYEVGILENAVLGHADTDGSTLDAGVNATATSLSVATTGAASGSPLWTTTAGDFPFDISLGGERITVQDITGSSSPQTFSPVVRSVNGVVKSQAAGADVRLWQPMYLGL